ncbi:MAG: hypothetical protein PF693_09385 [Spirochaetia bacterium]|jgi:hypothetical protein|nr:hypothetical protein [Spirochaetia bacterium]
MKNVNIKKLVTSGQFFKIIRNFTIIALVFFGLTSCDQCDPIPLPEPVSITRIAKYNAPSDYTELSNGETFFNVEN